MTSARAAQEARYRDRIRVDPTLTRRLVSFQANKTLPFYGLFKYKEGFSADLVRRCLRDAPPGGTVLDPFAAQAAGFHATGIEVLPVGAFAIKARSALGRVAPPKWVAFRCEVCGREMRYRRSEIESQQRRGIALPRFCSRHCTMLARHRQEKA
jgi:hypothetical protein